MASRLAALLPRLAVLTIVWLLAAASLTFAAATGRSPAKKPKADPTPQPKKAATVRTVVVPDVRRQPYVFAKGILEDAGFAWRVEGKVQGYATNIVVVQTPPPGTPVSGVGTPTVVLGLERNPDYEERGLPQNESPYPGDEPVEPTVSPKADTEPAPRPKAKSPAKAKRSAKVEAQREPKPAVDQDATPAEATKPSPKESSATLRAAAKPRVRTPAFEVPGAPSEPLDEMPLPDRARMVGKRLAKHAYPTNELIDWWLYQHAWVVTGAGFGWSDGAEAIRIMIRVDRDLQRRWGFGAKSEAVARAALAKVERLAK